MMSSAFNVDIRVGHGGFEVVLRPGHVIKGVARISKRGFPEIESVTESH